MIIAVAGPYSAENAEQRQKNLDALNAAAAEILKLGHIPVIGVNAALPVVLMMDQINNDDIMKISMAVVNACDALLLIGESPGANRERDLILKKGGRIFRSLKEITEIKN